MLAFAHTAITYIVPFLFVLTLVVTVHELGHFWAAKACGVAVDRFAIGFGRPILHWTDRSGVKWQVGWIPLGGYVRFAGDENEASVPDQNGLDDLRKSITANEGTAALNRYFHFKPLWQRAFVTAAGPFANFVLSTVLFALLLMLIGERVTVPRVDGVTPNQAAARAGFQVGDVIKRADGRRIDSFTDLQQIVMLRAETPIRFDIERGGQALQLTATPERKEITDSFGGKQSVGVLGLSSQSRQQDMTLNRYGPIEALVRGAGRTWDVLDTTVYYLGRIVTGRESAEQLGGPLGIARASGAVAQAGAEGAPGFATQIVGSFVALLGLAAVLSVGIGFMNLLPVPVLDGGHLMFYAYEAIARRPMNAAIQAAGYRVGLAMLLSLMLFATWNDLQQLRVFHFLGGLFS
jgi:regulator of sigma E protease